MPLTQVLQKITVELPPSFLQQGGAVDVGGALVRHAYLHFK